MGRDAACKTREACDPDARIKLRTVEVLRGDGGVVLDAKGKRLAMSWARDYMTGERGEQAALPALLEQGHL